MSAPPGAPQRPLSGLPPAPCPLRPSPCPLPPVPRPLQSCAGPAGLCGNFNGQESDDFQTAGGLVEATGAGFANTWKAQSSCQDKLDWLDDPCSLNIESGEARPRLGQLGRSVDGVGWGGHGPPCSGPARPSAAFCHVATVAARQVTGHRGWDAH